MKKFILSLAVMISLTAAQAANLPVTEEVRENFKGIFGSVHNVQWTENKGKFTAVFYDQEVKTVASFNADGKFLHSLRYYGEAGLPTNLRNKLAQSHASKSIFGVTEVTVGEQTAYYVKMQDQKKWYTIKIVPTGEQEIIEQYKKI